MKYRITFSRKNASPPDVRQTEVEASNEGSAIASATFELKRLIGFDSSWINTMPEDYGLHFLHGYRWDIWVVYL